MIIDKNITPYLVLEHEPIRNVLKKINSNEEGMVVCIDNANMLVGVLTDGDFRRWVMDKAQPDLDTPVGLLVNRDISSARIIDSIERISSQLSRQVHFLPLVDSEGRCVGLARERKQIVRIDNLKIGAGEPCYIIAEIGNNHNGDIDMAKRLVDEAIKAGADCAKFQLRDLESLYSNKGNASDAKEDLGSQYTLDLLSKFQLSRDEMFRVFDYCHKKGITPLCTPWDLPSVDALEHYGITAYKTASADLTNHDLLLKIAATGKPLICSTGMSTESELIESVGLLLKAGAQHALLHCNSTYPAPFKDINLRYLDTLRQHGNCPVGYSSHDRGINVVLAAVTLGANIIEKHFTLDTKMEGNDHRVSLLPDELSNMVIGIKQIEEAIGTVGINRRLSQGELMNREALGKSLFINSDLEPGDIIQSSMLEVRSPGKGLQPNRKSNIIGMPAKRKLRKGDVLFPSDLDEDTVLPRKYNFKRPFGIPVRYHDFENLIDKSNFDFLEFHFSYKDLEEDENKYFSKVRDLDFIVHAPELFENDHILDLCSLDQNYRKQSILNLQRVVDVTKRMNKWFSVSKRPLIIINAGGFTQDKPLEDAERLVRYEMILDSLSQMELDDVEIIPQTMPPFPWHFGGQRFQNLFMEPNEIAKFCKINNFRVCLDTSHSKLACNHYHWSFSEFLKIVGPYTAHLHIADASGVDGEGLQINDGDVDFPAMGLDLKEAAPKASFIPEIWQGHKDEGAGFWCALERLENYL